MAKLGKKARKFARKNLQSVEKRNRKHRSMVMKRKFGPVDKRAVAKKPAEDKPDKRDDGNVEGNVVDGAILENGFIDILSEVDEDPLDDISDSDDSLIEDPECPYISESENDDEDQKGQGDLDADEDIHMEIAKQKRKLDRLREKDPNFSEFLETRRSDLEQFDIEDVESEEDGTRDSDGALVTEGLDSLDKKALTSNTLDVWCWLATEQPSTAFPNLLNGFRAACHYGFGSHDNSSQRIPDREVFSKILTFVLSEADGVFRRQLGISETSSKESILKLKDSSQWQTVRPMVKCYLRSSMSLLNQITDSNILVFVLSRLKASVVFFAPFPSLVGRLIKILAHLWATGDEILSMSSFFIIRDLASQLGTDCLNTCLRSIYKAFTAHCKFAELTNVKHIELLGNLLVELYSVDIEKSYPVVLTYLQQLASALRQARKTKKKEELKKIHNWQYISCLKLWVKFIASNIKDHGLQPLLFLVIEVIRGIIHLYPAPRYFPLRFKCVRMLNQLSHSSGLFIPVASLVLDPLEYEGSTNANTRESKPFNCSSVLKVSKQLLKSQIFQEECILSTVELLASHFAQWSYHIAFPELATIPLILLKRSHSKTTVESVRRPIKKLIDQVEKNIEFIQKKRDEVAFSPSDQKSVESFLQLERSGLAASASFTQYYSSILRNSDSRTCTRII